MTYWGTRIGSILIALAGSFALQMAAKATLSDFGLRLVFLACLYVTLAVSLNLINGIAGQFSIGHAGFYMVGAYTGGFLSNRMYSAQSLGPIAWVILTMLAGAVVAGLAGLIVGLPSLRLRGDYLAIVTLGFGEIIRILVQNTKEVGAAEGLNLPLKVENPIWVACLLAVICVALCRNLMTNVHGLPFLAVRDDEVASGAMGVNVTSTKVVAFVLGSALAGAAGSLYAHSGGFIEPQMFTMETSFIILTMVVLGGTGSITGSAIAAILLAALPELLRQGPPTTAAVILAGAIAIVATVITIKRVGDSFHGSLGGKALRVLGAIVAGIVVGFILSKILGQVPSLAGRVIELKQLRLVIFAATLIILMLLRPQGIFAHHEFSWDWVRKWRLGRRPEVAA